MTEPLTPAAQAVLWAGLGRDSDRLVIAAALKAVVEQLGYTIFDYENNEHPGVVRVSHLLALAAELEGTK